MAFVSEKVAVLYPMHSEERQREHNRALTDELRQLGYEKIVDLTSFELEQNPAALEGTPFSLRGFCSVCGMRLTVGHLGCCLGTGALVLDRIHKVRIRTLLSACGLGLRFSVCLSGRTCACMFVLL